MEEKVKFQMYLQRSGSCSLYTYCDNSVSVVMCVRVCLSKYELLGFDFVYYFLHWTF